MNFRGIDFFFVFSDEELKLLSPVDKSREVRYKWLMKEIGDGVYTEGDPLVVEETSLIGTCNEIEGSIIFLPQFGSAITSSYNLIGDKPPVLEMKLSAYILCRFDRNTISRLTFTGPEINYIHPVNQAFSWTYDNELNERGILKFETRDYSSTSSKPHSFLVDGKDVSVVFGISRGISMRVKETPLTLKSSLSFEFEPCNDYQFILRLYRIAKEYISFLCYRKNIVFDEVALSSLKESGKYERFASLYVIDSENGPDDKALKRNRCIKQRYIEDGESKILQDIADNSIYLRHLPASFASGRHVDASRFVMITAAFEWEFKRMKPDGLSKSEKRKQAEEKVNLSIDDLIMAKTGKEKEIYKFLKKLIGAASLQNEIISACEELDTIVGAFGKRLYALNDAELVYADVGERLSEQRNHFAHGDIDKDFIGMSLLDLIFLEYIIYAMQLKYYGIEDDCIKKAINELFHLNFAL